MTDMNGIIANNILSVMHKKSIRQIDLATKIGVSKQVMSKMLSGDRMINAVELASISKAIDTSIVELVKVPYNTTEVNVLRAFMGEVHTPQAKSALEIADEIADLICFHSKCQENGEKMMKSWVQ